MAMVKCSGCGEEISDKAEKCIHCGKEFSEKESVKEELKCIECGKILSEMDEACPNCGCPVGKKEKKTKKNKIILMIVGGCIAIIILICTIFFAVVNSNPVKKYVYLFNNDKSKEAIAVYNEKIEEDKELENELSNMQNAEMDDIFKKFKGDKITYKDAEKQIESYIKYVPSKQYATDIKKKIDALNSSRAAYQDAQKAEKEKDIETALRKYKAVIEDDESYTEAQNRIQNLQESYKAQLLNESENYIQNKQYKEAIANIDKAISVLGSSDDLTELKQHYSELKADQYVKVVVTDKSVTPQDTLNWVFSSYINMMFDVTNNSDKAIKGIEGTLTVNDLFGKEILTINCDFVGTIIQPQETHTVSELSLECNEFMDEHMKFYDTEYKDLQFVYNISSIVYEDGSTVVPE